MKCNIEWLSAYLDGALSDDKRAKLEEHLKTCEACTAKLEKFARVEQTAKKIPAPQLSEAYWENFASRVQNKLTIREKQRTSLGWIEALKSFFQPTAGKLAIAGSVAVILLLTFASLEQWKKQTFRPPVFEAEKPVAEGKVDSVQVPAKDELAFRTTEIVKDKKAGLVEDKRLDQPIPEREKATLSQKPAENRPAASAPLGRALAAPAEQKSNEAPSLAASAEQDEAKSGDTVVVTAGRKAEIRKEVATSQVKVSAEEIEKLPRRNVIELLPGYNLRDLRQAITDNERLLNKKLSTNQADSFYVVLSRQYLLLYRISNKKNDWTRADKRLNAFLKQKTSDSTRQELLQIKNDLKSLKNQKPGRHFYVAGQEPWIEDIRQALYNIERTLSEEASPTARESLYILLATYYWSLNNEQLVYNHTLNENDWNKANDRISTFLEANLTDSTRQKLLQFQAGLRNLKK